MNEENSEEMMQGIETMGGLPVEMVEFILFKMDRLSLLRMTEVSKTIYKIIKSNEKLLTRLNLQLNYPSDLSRFACDIAKTDREYRRLSIVRTRDRGEVDDRISQRIFGKLGQTVKDLTVDYSQSQRWIRSDQRMFELHDRPNIEIQRRRRDLQENHLRELEVAYQRRFPFFVRGTDFQSELTNIFRHFGLVQKLSLKFVNLGQDLEQLRLERMAANQFVEGDESDEDDPRMAMQGDIFVDGFQPQQENNEPARFSQLKEVVMFRCDAQCFVLISTATQLHKLHIVDVSWTQRSPSVAIFERFLASQTDLRELHFEKVDIAQLLNTIRPEDIRFQLDSLLFQEVTMQNRHVLNSFLKTQNQLKFLEFTMKTYEAEPRSGTFFNNILLTICAMKRLKDIKLSKKGYRLDNLEFLFDVTNYSVRRLTYHVTNEDNTHDLFKSFLRMFPNLESITFCADEHEDRANGICFENETKLETVRKLSVKNISLESLRRITAPLLHTFICDPGKTGTNIDSEFNDFFLRHRTIKNLALGYDSHRSYFFTTQKICEYIADYLPEIEHITIYKFETVNKPIQFLLEKLTKLQSLTVTVEDYKKFSRNTRLKIAARNVRVYYKEPNECPLPAEPMALAQHE